MRKDFEAYIEGCIQDVIKQGWIIDKGTFINPAYKKCCPLGAVGIVHSFDIDTDTYLLNIEHVLDIEGSTLTVFWMDFDTPGVHLQYPNTQYTEEIKKAIEVAEKLNRKYLKTNGTQ